MKTLVDLEIAIDKYKEEGKNYKDLYYDNIQTVMENEIRKAGYIKEEHIKSIAEKEIIRVWENQHSSGIQQVVNELYYSSLID